MKKDKNVNQNVKKMTEDEKLSLFKVAAKGGDNDGICWVSK